MNIESIIRKKKKKYYKVKSQKIPDLIKRDLNATHFNQKWSIDITYIHTVAGVAFLCCIKDMNEKYCII